MVIEARRCHKCNRKLTCSLKIRIANLSTHLAGHTTGKDEYDWMNAFAEVCKHYDPGDCRKYVPIDKNKQTSCFNCKGFNRGNKSDRPRCRYLPLEVGNDDEIP